LGARPEPLRGRQDWLAKPNFWLSRALTGVGGRSRFRAEAVKRHEFKRKRIDEGSGAGKAGRRLQRQGPRQERRDGRRTRQRQDVDESVRRNRCRGSLAAEGGRQGDRGRGGL